MDLKLRRVRARLSAEMEPDGQKRKEKLGTSSSKRVRFRLSAEMEPGGQKRKEKLGTISSKPPRPVSISMGSQGPRTTNFLEGADMESCLANKIVAKFKDQGLMVVDQAYMQRLVDDKVQRLVDDKMQGLDDKIQVQVHGLKATLMAEIWRVAGRNTYISQTPAELGGQVKELAIIKEDCVPQPVDEVTANRVWGTQNVQMWNSLQTDSTYRILEEDFKQMLERVDLKMCLQQMTFTGQAQEESSEQKKIDFAVHIKGRDCFPCYTTALLSLHSIPDPGKRSKKPKYNGKGPLGHAIRRASTVLRNAGPARKKIVVGVTNLRSIQWYTVEKGFEDDAFSFEGPYLYNRTLEINEVKCSLAAILMTDLLCLGSSITYTVDGSSVEFCKLLGGGATSTVYSCYHMGSNVAAKVYKRDFNALSEVKFLTELQGVPGVPTMKGVATNGKLLLLSPVGMKIRRSVPREAKRNIAGLVDTLRSAHGKGIVHRDVRFGNIVLVDSSFLLIDWGFASEVGDIRSFRGSLLTASSRIFNQHGKPMEYKPEDDLVSLVKSLYLLGHESFDSQLRCLLVNATDNSIVDVIRVHELWKTVIDESVDWKRALELAENLSYDDLKNWINHWAVNYCP